MSGGGDDKRPSRVLEFLYIGSRSHAKNRGLLKELGINRILNVTPTKTTDPANGVPNFFEKDKSMTYKRVPVFDNRGEDILQHLQSCISFIEQGKFYGKVLVHCNKGVSRSATVVAAYLMSTRGLARDAALTYLRKRRSIINPHEAFMAQLQTFDRRLKVELEAAIADGQPPKFPDDLLGGTRGGTVPSGRPVGPIGPPRGPLGPSPPPRTVNTSPTRRVSKRPAAGPSPPRDRKLRGPMLPALPTPPAPSLPSRPSGNPGVVIGPEPGPPAVIDAAEKEIDGRTAVRVCATGKSSSNGCVVGACPSAGGGSGVEKAVVEVEQGGASAEKVRCSEGLGAGESREGDEEGPAEVEGAMIGPAIGPLAAPAPVARSGEGDKEACGIDGGGRDVEAGKALAIGPAVPPDVEERPSVQASVNAGTPDGGGTKRSRGERKRCRDEVEDAAGEGASRRARISEGADGTPS